MAQWLSRLEGLFKNHRGSAARVGWEGGVWLVTGVVEENLSIPVPHVRADTISASSMWLLLRHVLLLL